MPAIPRVRHQVELQGPLGPRVADRWIFAQAVMQRSGSWSPWMPLPEFLAALPGVERDLAAHGATRWLGRWAPLAAGGYLWAAYEQGGMFGIDRVWIFEITGSSSDGDSRGGSSAGGLPPGAPPANQAPEPLERLRQLIRRRGIT